MEMYTSESPYSFSGNNPVNNVDPSGMNYQTSMCNTHSDGGFMYRGSYTRCGNGGGGSSYGGSNVGRNNPGYNGPGANNDIYNSWYDVFGGTGADFMAMYGMGWKPGMSANGFLNVALENGYGFIYSIEKGHYVYKTIYGFVASKKIISKEFFDDEGNYTNSGFISHSGVIGLIPDAMYRFKNDNGGEGLFSMSVGYSGSAYDFFDRNYQLSLGYVIDENFKDGSLYFTVNDLDGIEGSFDLSLTYYHNLGNKNLNVNSIIGDGGGINLGIGELSGSLGWSGNASKNSTSSFMSISIGGSIGIPLSGSFYKGNTYLIDFVNYNGISWIPIVFPNK